MGGRGSGRWVQHRKKATVEGYYCVDIAEFKEEIVRVARGKFSGVEWNMFLYEPDFCELRLALAIEKGILALRLVIRDAWVNDLVLLQSSVPHYGGRRWWLTCLQCCGRVRKIYWSAGCSKFACRKCWDLAYHSQRRTRLQRTRDRVSRIKFRLGARGKATAPIAPTPHRPEGMRRRIYWRLVNQLRNAEQQCDEALAVWLRHFKGKRSLSHPQVE